MLIQFRQKSQRGAILVVSLIVLVVMTLLVLGMLKTAVLELKIGGVNHQAELNFANAESMISKYLNENNGKFSKDCLSAVPSLSCFLTTDTTFTTILGTAPNQVMRKRLDGADLGLTACSGNTDPTALPGPGCVGITAQQIACGDDSGVGSGNMIGGGLNAVYLNVQSVAQGVVSGRGTVHQGIKSQLPPGGCS